MAWQPAVLGKKQHQFGAGALGALKASVFGGVYVLYSYRKSTVVIFNCCKKNLIHFLMQSCRES